MLILGLTIDYGPYGKKCAHWRAFGAELYLLFMGFQTMTACRSWA